MKINKFQFFALIVGSIALTHAALVKANFLDVPSNHIASEAIEYVRANNIVQGYPDGTFKPDKTINRAEFTKIIIEASPLGDGAIGNNCFPDVKNEWFAKYVCTAYEAGIIKGYPDGTFKPAQTIVFAEAAKIIVNSLYTDLKLKEDEGIWYRSFVEILGEKNAFNYLKNLSYVDQSTLGMIGFSRGGALSINFASQSQELKALVIMASAPTGVEDQMESLVAQISAPALFMVAENDTPSQLNGGQNLVTFMQDLQHAFEAAGKISNLIIYPPFKNNGHLMFFELGEYTEDLKEFLDQYMSST